MRGGCGRGTPPAQLGGLGGPDANAFLVHVYISCSKHCIKLRAKTEIVYESNNSAILRSMYMYYNRMKQFSGMCLQILYTGTLSL